MRSFGVVPLDPPPYLAPSLGEAAELMLPRTLFLQRSEEPFDEPVLLRRVGRHELLGESVVTAGCTEPPASEGPVKNFV